MLMIDTRFALKRCPQTNARFPSKTRDRSTTHGKSGMSLSAVEVRKTRVAAEPSDIYLKPASIESDRAFNYVRFAEFSFPSEEEAP